MPFEEFIKDLNAEVAQRDPTRQLGDLFLSGFCVARDGSLFRNNLIDQ